MTFMLTLLRQVMFSVFGGKVEGTGEILHGKTSPLRHDNKGVYAGLPQDLPVTRYHSLAGTHTSLPECLEVSSWISTGPDGGKGIIMGVRHKEHTTEGVQFHPESILTEEGRVMIRNFLQLQGGTLGSMESRGQNRMNGSKKQSILYQIFTRRKEVVRLQRDIPGQRMEDLRRAYDIGTAPPLVDFVQRLRKSPFPCSLMAEVKRASPSKGVISLTTCAPEQACKYARIGASVISVLTEPDWFKGHIEDMRQTRQALAGMPNRPAVLRKDFIFDEYQILEARLAGADTVLLIVKMLDSNTLERLYKYSRSLGMEPLVEVNNEEEMGRALELGSKVIGVNNRNLVSFDVDMDTTSRLAHKAPEGTIICALSGISTAADLTPYISSKVGAVLVGEALMRADDPAEFASDLFGSNTGKKPLFSHQPLVKICGTRTVEAAKSAIEAGADLIGIILVQGRRRCVDTPTAKAISDVVHETCRAVSSSASSDTLQTTSTTFFEFTTNYNFRCRDRALLVGVFQDQPLEYVIEQCHSLRLDVVQLHGSEPLEWASLIPVPVIHGFNVGDHGINTHGYHALSLIDAGKGGSGEQVDLSEVRLLLQQNPELQIMLAGGLTAQNVPNALAELEGVKGQVTILDVSSGVEEDGLQSVIKIKEFLTAAKRS